MWSGGFPSIGGFGGFNRCRGCDHPRPAYTGGYGSVRSDLGTMLTHSKFIGCEVCTILSDGILKFLENNSCGVKREHVDDLQLDFNLAASRRSIEVVLLRTPVRLTFYASESGFCSDYALGCWWSDRLTGLLCRYPMAE